MSSTIPYIKYPVDWTGIATSNRVIKEPRTIGSNASRAFVPDGGPFYAESVRVYNALTGLPLTKQQFKVLHPLEEASKRAGKGVACVIYIEDKTVGTQILYDCQLVGGEFSWATSVIEQALLNINLDNRPVSWGDLLDIPTSFKPSPHLHDVGDTYGWEYILLELERIRRAILIGDAESHEELRRQYMYLIEQLERQVEAALVTLRLHAEDRNNPHQVTKEQVGLGLVPNNPMANDAEARAMAALNRLMSPAMVKILVEHNFMPVIMAHIANQDNPHATTAAQVGAYTIAQVDQRLNEKLGKTETAVDSLKFATRTYQEAYNHIRAALEASLVTSGIFQSARLGSGASNDQKILVGGVSQAQWMDFESMISKYMAEKNVGQIYYAGNLANYGPGSGDSYGAALAIVRNTYIDPVLYPPGTIVIFKGTYYVSVGTGNGSRWDQRGFTAMVIKVAGGGWERIL